MSQKKSVFRATAGRDSSLNVPVTHRNRNTNKTLKWAETRFKWGKKVGRVKKKIVTLVFQNIWMTWEKYTKSKKHKELCALLLLRMENRCFKEWDPFGDSRGPDEVNKVVGVLRRSCRCNGPFCWSLEVLVCIYVIPGDSSGPEEFFCSFKYDLTIFQR